MSSQAQPKIQGGNSLDTSETTSNVATNRAALEALKAANIDGKDTYPASVSTKHLIADNGVFQGYMKSGAMLVGSGGVAISSAADGDEPTGAAGIFMGISSDKAMFYLNDATGTPTAVFDGSDGSVSITGTITATDGAFPGSLITGNISVGSGGVTVSNDGGTSGIYIGGNQIWAKVGGVSMFLLNGATGEISAKKFSLTADASNSVDLSLGTHVLATSITVGAQTLGDIQTNATTGAGRNRTFYQTSAPTASNTGDLWLDSDASPPTLYRWNGSSWTTQEIGTVSHTYAQTSQPSSGMVAGDLWIDTDDSNKLYRYSGSTWTVYRDSGAASGATAIQPGGGVSVDGSKYITTIDMSSGLTIRSSSSTAKTQLTSNGMAIYNSSGTVVVQADHTNGLWVNNASATPGVTERLSLAYGGTEKGNLSAVGANIYLVAMGAGAVRAREGMSNESVVVASTASGNVYLLGPTYSDSFNSYSFTVYRRDDSSNTQATVYYTELTNTLRIMSATLATSPANYSTTSGGTADNWGSYASVGDLLTTKGGALWLRYSGGTWKRIYGTEANAATAHPS